MKILGYGSLLSGETISEHKIDGKVAESDLVEAHLHGYKRSWNAQEGPDRFLGLIRDKLATTNGVIFDLTPKELPGFKKSEGVGSIYRMVDVGSQIDPSQKEPVYTLVTITPSNRGKISKDYLADVKKALTFRSHKFQLEFHKDTPAAK